jgi:hypothetical protein
MQIKQAMLRDIYKMAEEKAKDLSKQPAPKKPEMFQAEKERSLGIIGGMNSNLMNNPEPINQGMMAAGVAGGLPIPGLVRESGTPSYVRTIAEKPLHDQYWETRRALELAYPQMDRLGKNHVYPPALTNGSVEAMYGRNADQPFDERIQDLRERTLLNNLGE